MSHPKTKIRIHAVELICTVCGEAIAIDDGHRAPDYVTVWSGYRYPPTTPNVCECKCGKKHIVPKQLLLDIIDSVHDAEELVRYSEVVDD